MGKGVSATLTSEAGFTNASGSQGRLTAPRGDLFVLLWTQFILLRSVILKPRIIRHFKGSEKLDTENPRVWSTHVSHSPLVITSGLMRLHEF